jgi:ferric-dicitrate binding protein FerR (iron transport regulator)
LTVDPFTSTKRHVELVGEAFFEISHDVKRPFTITCNQTETEVVGTSFNIKQLKEVVELYVRSGKVIFRSETTRKMHWH